MHLYARPVEAEPGEALWVEDLPLATLHCPSVSAAPMTCTFEGVAAAMARLDRMFLELDGAFVWTGIWAGEPWQIDGMLYDHADQLRRVELKGGCPRAEWFQMLRIFGWPAQPLVAHWIDVDRFLDVEALAKLWPAPNA